jgi:hypothetical protein
MKDAGLAMRWAASSSSRLWWCARKRHLRSSAGGWRGTQEDGKLKEHKTGGMVGPSFSSFAWWRADMERPRNEDGASVLKNAWLAVR